ncbi:serine hydrolase domain-containing protein [Marivirga sp.]|uniref:serine hydrolase domain-containing protein n=1 Tax=Marivirga sp. TaxID=2018662 RepID=UPI002D8091A6|nr:serine hydrolase domain-containing protein [Marivirga sp.]HET8859717.1 serine hydrolase domain-containing protein [Marivirga sp.]
MKKLLSTYLLLFIFYIGSAQEFNKSKADSLLQSIEENNEGMGSVTILKDGKVIYENAYGFADINDGKKNNINTLFRIGSISKTYTATLVMLAVEEGLISLDDKLSKYYPDFDKADEITISQLLQHRSGIYNFTNSPLYAQYMTKSKSKAEMLEIMLSTENRFEPNEKFEYSNTGYALLSYILEDVYGLKYAEILKKKITEPLELQNTYFGQPINQNANEASSYFKTAEWQISPETNIMIPMGAGGITATSMDVALFFEALFSGQILKESSFSKMKKMKDGFGYGLLEMPYDNEMILGHTGGIDGFQSIAVHFESENLTLALLCNAVSYSRNDILLRLLFTYFDKDFEIPDFEPDVVFTYEDVVGFKGIYSADNFPLKITISVSDNNQLMAQATGQSAFPLTPVDKYNFKFDPAGIKIIFDDENPQLTLEQAGRKFKLDKEEDNIDD